MSLTTLIAKELAVTAGKALITKFIKGKRMRFCPQCGAKVYIRRHTRR